MNYLKIYNDLVDKARPRGLDKSKLEGYYEKHHILPKCMGGKDTEDNFVLFTAREHVVAHHLLWRANPKNHSLMWAYSRTLNTKEGKLRNSRQVEYLKIVKSEVMRNREISDETKEKIRQTLKGRKVPREVVEKSRKKNTGRKRSAETKALLSLRRQELLESGWQHTEEAKKKISEASRGREVSEETRKKLSDINKGKEIPEHQRKLLSEIQKSLKPWEKSSVKARKPREKVWREADLSFNVWVENGRPGSWAFSTIVSKLHCVEYSVSHFDTLIKLFRNGWVPSEDEDWLKFKNSFDD